MRPQISYFSSLGARHDGDDNNCSADDHYVMMPALGRSTDTNYANVYKFSPCSIDEIYSTVSALREWVLHLQQNTSKF